MIAKELHTVSGFIERYFHHSTHTKTLREAYEETEKEYFEYYGVNRYASYGSFRVVLCANRKKSNSC